MPFDYKKSHCCESGKSRYELKSLYDPDRRTFIYDIGKYDKVLIVTDSPEIKESQETLINAVRMQNKDITVVRWC